MKVLDLQKVYESTLKNLDVDSGDIDTDFFLTLFNAAIDKINNELNSSFPEASKLGTYPYFYMEHHKGLVYKTPLMVGIRKAYYETDEEVPALQQQVASELFIALRKIGNNSIPVQFRNNKGKPLGIPLKQKIIYLDISLDAFKQLDDDEKISTLSKLYWLDSVTEKGFFLSDISLDAFNTAFDFSKIPEVKLTISLSDSRDEFIVYKINIMTEEAT